MAITLLGSTSGNGFEVDDLNRGLTTPRPPSFGSLGSYRINAQTGAITATLGANSPLLSFRYAGSNLVVLEYIRVSMSIASAITAAVPFSLEAIWARGFTAADTGGTGLTLTGNNAKDRTSLATPGATINVATTAALTAGTRTLDNQGFGGVNFGTGTAVGSTALPLTELFSFDGTSRHPIIIANQEGFIIRNPDAGPATGTFKIMFNIGWIEVPTTYKP
jgi:hypothetical protein